MSLTSRRRGVGALLLSLPIAACTAGGGDGGDVTVVGADYTLHLVPVVPTNQSPFDDVDKLDLVLTPSVGDPVRLSLGDPDAGTSSTAEDLPALDGTVIEVEGYAQGDLVAWGRTEPLTAETGEVEVDVFVARTDAFGWLPPLPQALQQAAIARVGDGRFVIAGGITNDINDRPDKRSSLLFELSLAPTGALPAFEEAGSLPAYESEGGGAAQTERIGAVLTPLTAAGADQGLVLLTGGGLEHPYSGNGSPTVSDWAHLYDPAAGTWTDVDALSESRMFHLAVENLQGNVVVWGGWTYQRSATNIGWPQRVEVYERATRRFMDAGTSSELGAIDAAAADLGLDGTLICGGATFDVGSGDGWTTSAACARVSLDGSALDADANLPVGLAGHAMVTLADGRVLVAGGASGTSATEADRDEIVPARAETWLYSPTSRSWAAGRDMAVPRVGHRMVVLADGRVVIAGGSSTYSAIDAGWQPISCVEVFDPSSSTFTSLEDCTAADEAGGMAGRALQPLVAADPLRGVLVAGGTGSSMAQDDVGIYVPAP